MKIKCKECADIEEFEDKEEAKDNDWHKVKGTHHTWICPDCYDDKKEAEKEDKDEDDDDDDDDIMPFHMRSGGFSFGGGRGFGGGSFGGGGSGF